jgi:hypothetical protein
LSWPSCFLPAAPTPSREQERVVAYLPNWIDLPAVAGKIDCAKVPLLNITFEDSSNDSSDLSFSGRNGALLASAKTHGVPVLVSIGGGMIWWLDCDVPGERSLLTATHAALHGKERASADSSWNFQIGG